MSYPSEVLADSPYAYYHLDDAASPLLDSSGNARNLTVAGSPTYQQPSLLANYSNTCIRLTTPAGADAVGVAPNAAPFTFEAWVKFNAVNATQRIACPGGAGSGGWGAGINSSGKWRFTTFGILDYDSTSGPLAATTYHVVWVFDTSFDIQLYVDGSFVQTILGAANPGATAFPIRLFTRDFGTSTEPLQGYADEVAFYSSALSAARIAAHYQAGAGAQGDPPTPVPPIFHGRGAA